MRFRYSLSLGYRTFQWALSTGFPKISNEHRYIGRRYRIVEFQNPRMRRNLIYRILYSRTTETILKDEACRRWVKAMLRVDRVSLLESEGFMDLTKRGNSTPRVNEDSLRASILGSVHRVDFVWPLSIVGTLLIAFIMSPFIPYDGFVNLLLRTFAKSGNTEEDSV